jgi:hypothetical protein
MAKRKFGAELTIRHPDTGVEYTLRDIAKLVGESYEKIYGRRKIGWTDKEIFGLTPRIRPGKYIANKKKTQKRMANWKPFSVAEEMRQRARDVAESMGVTIKE